MLNSNYNLVGNFSSVAMVSSLVSPTIDLSLYNIGSISVVWTGSPVGYFVLQCSNEVQNSLTFPAADVTSASFDNVSGSVVTVSAAGQQTWSMTNLSCWRWVRLSWVATSGTGTITACNVNLRNMKG